MSDYPSILLVFAAGLLSFLSPCVFPLIPSYLSILGGAGAKALSSVKDDLSEDEQTGKNRFILVITTLFFILGFTAVFVILSIIISATFMLMGGVLKFIQIAAGIIVIILGFNIIFDFIKILNYEKRFYITKKTRGFFGAFLAGTAFGAGWTPCIGPVLAGVLFLAGQSGQAGIAALYLVLYSLGLGIPFLLAALFFDRYLVPAKWFKDKLPVIKKISGILLIIIGILILTGRFTLINITLQRWQYQYIFWAQDKALPFRVLADWLNWINF